MAVNPYQDFPIFSSDQVRLVSTFIMEVLHLLIVSRVTFNLFVRDCSDVFSCVYHSGEVVPWPKAGGAPPAHLCAR